MGNKILINITGDKRVKDGKNHLRSLDDPFLDKTKEDYDKEKTQEYHNQLMPKVNE